MLKTFATIALASAITTAPTKPIAVNPAMARAELHTGGQYLSAAQTEALEATTSHPQPKPIAAPPPTKPKVAKVKATKTPPKLTSKATTKTTKGASSSSSVSASK